MDEKMIRAVLAGHALGGMLANRWRDMPHETSKAQIAAEAVRWSDALLVELKKDSPAPARESAPPLADEARVPGDVVPQCEAYGCERQGAYVFRFTPISRGHFCGIHIYVRPESILIEWHRAAAKKARAA